MKSGYATTDGLYDVLGGYDIPNVWWSRRYEYPWVAKFIEPTDVVVDAGCDIEHFFKYFLADVCSSVIAVDADPEIINCEHRNNMRLIEARLDSMPIADATADKVVCISVFEHTDRQQDILKEFARVLKPSGRLIITLDIPTIQVQQWKDMVENSVFEFDGDVNWERPENVLVEPKPRRKVPRTVFCSVLRKKPC